MLATTRMILAGVAVVVILGRLVAGPLPAAAAADDQAVEEGAAGPDAAPAEEAPRMLADEAVANGLPRDVAEKVFAAARLFGDRTSGGYFDSDASSRERMLFANEISLVQLLSSFYWRANEQRMFQEHGMSMSGSGDGVTIERGQVTFRFAKKGQGVHYGVSHAGEPRRSLTLTADGPVITIEWESSGDADGDGEETVRIKQAADRFRLVHLRDDETIMKLEGASFRHAAHGGVARCPESRRC